MRHLSQDLTSDQEKLPRNRKNPFTGKKGKKPSGEQQRRIPLQTQPGPMDPMRHELTRTPGRKQS